MTICSESLEYFCSTIFFKAKLKSVYSFKINDESHNETTLLQVFISSWSHSELSEDMMKLNNVGDDQPFILESLLATAHVLQRHLFSALFSRLLTNGFLKVELKLWTIGVARLQVIQILLD